MEKDYNAARCAAGKGSAVGAARIKGGIFSFHRKRISPLLPPKRKDEGPSPSTPHIGSLDLEELHALRNVSAVYMASP